MKSTLFPLPLIRNNIFYHGSQYRTPTTCESCVNRECGSAGPIGVELLCSRGVNYLRVDSEYAICGFYLETYAPKHPTPRPAQKAFKKQRRLLREQPRDGSRGEPYITATEWGRLVAGLERWLREKNQEAGTSERRQLGTVLSSVKEADKVRAMLRELRPGLDSGVHHDVTQLATAISSAIENILDIKYGNVQAAAGWKRPPVLQAASQQELWLREKAIYYYSDLLSIRLSLGVGLPDEASLMDMEALSPHGMFKKILEPYKLLGQEKGVRFRVHGMETGTTLAPYEPFLIPPLAVIDNALKYAPPDSEIEVHFAQDNSVIEVEVTSMGPRIHDNEREAIFTAGTRGRDAEAISEGQGLGLWLARTLLGRWGGHIGVDQVSVPQRGTGAHKTTFSIRYPLEHKRRRHRKR
jgi:hypothetical protein